MLTLEEPERIHTQSNFMLRIDRDNQVDKILITVGLVIR